MAWNRADTSSQSAARKPASKSPSLVKGAIAGLVVVAVLGLAAFFLFSGKDAQPKTQTESSAKSRLLEDNGANVAKVTTRTNEAVSGAKPTRQKTGEVRDGKIMLSNGKLLPEGKYQRARKGEDRIAKFKYAVFDHSTDNELAAILTLKPGQMLVGGPIRHGGGYEKRFLKSLETPIIVSKDDPEDIQDVKRAVIQARKDLKVAYDNGEDIQKIVNDAYAEAQKLDMYKNDLRREVMKIANQGDLTDEELEQVFKASNEMLEKKGIAPMKFGVITRARLKTLKLKQ